MAFISPESFEPAPTATIIHAYNSEGVSLVTLSDEEIYSVIKASGANLIGKPNMHPRVTILDRYIEERGIQISQVEQSLAIEESHASYFWEKQVSGKNSFESACMEVNTCGDSLSPKVLGTFLDACDYPELVSFIYFAPTPLLKDYPDQRPRVADPPVLHSPARLLFALHRRLPRPHRHSGREAVHRQSLPQGSGRAG